MIASVTSWVVVGVIVVALVAFVVAMVDEIRHAPTDPRLDPELEGCRFTDVAGITEHRAVAERLRRAVFDAINTPAGLVVICSNERDLVNAQHLASRVAAEYGRDLVARSIGGFDFHATFTRPADPDLLDRLADELELEALDAGAAGDSVAAMLRAESADRVRATARRIRRIFPTPADMETPDR